MRQALDTDEAANLRTRAIEKLDSMEATLHPSLLRELLDDKDPSVAKYSLGLISLSADRDALIEEAKNSPHTTDAAFLTDLELLKNIPRPTISLDSDLRNYNAGGSRYVQRNEGGIRNREGSP